LYSLERSDASTSSEWVIDRARTCTGFLHLIHSQA